MLNDELEVLHIIVPALRHYTVDCIHLRLHYPSPSRFLVAYD